MTDEPLRLRVATRVTALLLPAVPVGLLVVGAWAANSVGSWAWLSGSDYVPDYSDLQQITATAECAAGDPSWSLESETCDPNGRAYNYPAVWARSFAMLGIQLRDTHQIGLAFIGLLLVTVLALGWLVRGAWSPLMSRSRRAVGGALWVLACVSPPFWLAMDRGNSDIVVLAIVVLAVCLSVWPAPVVPGIVVGFAGLLKVFALGSGLMLLAQRRARVWTLTAWLFASGAAILVLLPDLPLISARTPRSHWMSFGVSVLPIRYQHLLADWEGNGKAIGLVAMALFGCGLALVLLLLLLPAARRSGDRLAQGLVSHPGAATLFLGGSGTFLAAYLVGTGYDYRLMFVALCVGGLLISARASGAVGLVAAAVLVLLMWWSGPWAALGDLADWVWLLAAPALALLTAAVCWRLLRSDAAADAPLLNGERPSS